MKTQTNTQTPYTVAQVRQNIALLLEVLQEYPVSLYGTGPGGALGYVRGILEDIAARGIADEAGKLSEANSAAPELLAALQLMTRSFESHFPYGQELNQAREAIAKATGK